MRLEPRDTATWEVTRHPDPIARLFELASLKLIALDTRPFDLSKLTHLQIDRFVPIAGKTGVTIDRKITPGVTLRGAEGLVGQLVGNLLSNAVKYNHPGGKVTVSLTRSELWISDTGPGIPATELETIFDRLRSNRPHATDGSGFGLPISKRIAHAHGWHIWAESETGNGATFIVGFRSRPAADGAASAHAGTRRRCR